MGNDLISRKAVIDILESVRLNEKSLEKRYLAADIQEQVEKLPSAYDGFVNDDWIPIEERLPTQEEYLENDGRFILDDGNRRYQGFFDIYDGKFKFAKHISGINYELFDDNCVIAWQALPKRYQPANKIKPNKSILLQGATHDLGKEVRQKELSKTVDMNGIPLKCTDCMYSASDGKDLYCSKNNRDNDDYVLRGTKPVWCPVSPLQ